MRLMNSLVKIRERMIAKPASIRFSELKKICEHYFGTPRQSKGSHLIFKTPWPGNPRVNIQNRKGMAKPYQVKQVLMATEKVEVNNGS